MKIRTKRTALYAWLPVLCLVALALSTAPGSSEARQDGSLTISPDRYYGGQGITFKGNIGTGGKRSIWLEFHMGRAGDEWTRIEGSTHETAADGSFEFTFPARGMNNIKIRVAAAGGLATEQKNFTAHDQAVTLAVQPADLDYGDSYCGGSRREFISYDAVSAEGYTLTVDSAPDGEPVLEGRGVTLEKRVGGSKWQQVDTGTINNSGRATFNLTAPAGSDRTAYRARLAEWTKNGSEIGWYPSFPTYVDARVRPDDATIVGFPDPDLTDPPSYVYPEDLTMTWALPADTGPVEDVLVAWRQGTTPPSQPDAPGVQVEELPTGATSLELHNLQPNRNYSFAVLTRTAAGICSHADEDTGKTDPVPTPPAVTGVTATMTSPATWPTDVTVGWTRPTGQAITALHIVRDGQIIHSVDNPTDLAAPTTYTDNPPWPNTTYHYEVYTENQWSELSPVEAGSMVDVTTPEVTP